MSDEPNYDQEMKLPEGKTCADCYAVRFCVGIGCTTAPVQVGQLERWDETR